MLLPFCNREFDLNKLENTIHFLTDQPGFASLGGRFWHCWVWVQCDRSRGEREEI